MDSVAEVGGDETNEVDDAGVDLSAVLPPIPS